MTSTTALRPARPLTARGRSLANVPGRWGLLLDAALLFVIGAAIAFAFSWVPSLWYDESATVVSATRSWSSLAGMLTTVDIVHATYYAFMHLWFDVFAYSPVSLRMPSVLASGAAAAATMVLGRMLAGRRVGLLAGLLFAVMPRVTWMGEEGRSFAIGTLLAATMTILFVLAWRRTTAAATTAGGTARARRTSAGWWVAYTFVAALGSAVFLYIALLVVAHGVTAVLWAIRDRRRAAAQAPQPEQPAARRALLRWALSAVLVGAGILPLALAASRQSGQIHWIPRPSIHTVSEVFTTQWFTGNLPFAVVAWLLMLGASALTVVRGLWFARGRRVSGGTQATAASARRMRRRFDVVLVALPVMVIPTAALIALSVVRTPLYSPRYLTFTAPGAAILMAMGLAAVPWRSVIAVVVAAMIVLSVPTIIAQRQVTAKDSSAWNEVAALVGSQRATEPSGSIDDVIYGPVDRHPLTTSRVIAQTYPAAFAGMDDITLETPADQTDGMWPTEYPVADVLGATTDARTVWLVTGTSNDWRPAVTAELRAHGFHVDGTWSFSRTNVVRYER